MIPLKTAVSSSVVRKMFTAVTGLALVGFVIMHLAGNLTLLSKDPAMFNGYAAKLESMGTLLTLARIGLYTFFIVHIVNGILLKLNHKSARPIGYHSAKTKGGPSKSTLASRNMAVTGILITIFLVIHLKQFSWGPEIEDGYVTELAGHKIRDLHRLVTETFSNPLIVGFYVLTMIMLFKHLSHGFWSAFQSLGAISKRQSQTVYCLGWFLAMLLGVGFLVIPVWVYLRGGVAS